MTRITKGVYADIDFGNTIKTIPGAKLTIRTNIPIGWMGDLNHNDGATVIDFLHRVIADWKGFDLPLSRESIYSLTLEETTVILPRVEQTIMSPPEEPADIKKE